MSTPAKLQPIAHAPQAGQAASANPYPAPGQAVPVTEQDFATLVESARAEYYALSEAAKGMIHQMLNDIEGKHGALPAIHTLFGAKVQAPAPAK